jgi:hypothetical protein
MATKQALYRAAALILKESGTTLTVTDDDVTVNTLNVVYDSCLGYVLESGKWNFAARTLQIDSDEDEEPEFGYNFAFEKPSDYKNLIKLSASPSLYPPLPDNGYADEGNFWFADIDPLYASIVSDGAQYGGDLSLWPDIVARALEYELAFRVAPHVTSMGEDAFDRLEKRKEKALLRAKSWDASKQPTERPPPSRLQMARGGRMSRRDTWWP